ncbi:MAG: glycosyltransferase [Bacteroidota bacterium]
MKILFVGNQGNTGYRFVAWLRERGLEASLAIPKNRNLERSLPEWQSPELKGGYPEWIIRFRENRYPYFFPNRRLKKLSRQYDILLTTGMYILPVLKLKKPVGFLPVGGDITQVPFASDSILEEVFSFLYRRRIKNVCRIFTEQKDCIWAARLLGQGGKVEKVPFWVDVKEIKKNINKVFLDKLKEKYSQYDWLFYNPSRKNLNPEKANYKGTEKLLNAYSRFIKNHPGKKILMICGLHGDDVNAFKEKVNQLGLVDAVEFVGHMPLPDLHAYMSMENVVVFDQFTSDLSALGGVTREALSLGNIVVTSTDVNAGDFVEAYGEDCPLLPAFNEQQIYRRMEEIIALSNQEVASRKQDIMNWAENHLHWEKRIDEFIRMLNNMINSI